MPDAFTPALGLTLPEVGASRDSWGAKLNSNTQTIDNVLNMAMPIGAILDFAGPQAPSGWLICDGRLVSRTTYSKLFAIIGTYWGAGDGSTNFALPPTSGRATIGAGTVVDDAGNGGTYGFTQRLGAQYRQIAQANLPNYPMWSNVTGTHNHTGPVTAGGSHAHTTDAQGTHSHTGNTTGENVDHNHAGYTDAQGSHQHWITQTNQGTGAAFGGNAVLSPIFGTWSQNTDTQGNHSHNVQTYGQNTAHSHAIYADGNHAHNVYAVGDHVHYIQWEGDHQHYIYLGGSSAWFDIRTPVMVVTKIIYAGQQASTMVAVASAPATLTLEGQDELAAIRQELADLRAILLPPPHPRLLSAPMRGPH